jgi:hypothetical protein
LSISFEHTGRENPKFGASWILKCFLNNSISATRKSVNA